MDQSSWLPSGRYRRILIGIFLSLSSFIAIFNGSVSFSMSTITGAFMLSRDDGFGTKERRFGETRRDHRSRYEPRQRLNAAQAKKLYDVNISC